MEIKLRNGIQFGDTPVTVSQKETAQPEAVKLKKPGETWSKWHLLNSVEMINTEADSIVSIAYNGVVTGQSDVQIEYHFDELHKLQFMGYRYYFLPEYGGTPSATRKQLALFNDLSEGLNYKYGAAMLSYDKTIASGAIQRNRNLFYYDQLPQKHIEMIEAFEHIAKKHPKLDKYWDDRSNAFVMNENNLTAWWKTDENDRVYLISLTGKAGYIEGLTPMSPYPSVCRDEAVLDVSYYCMDSDQYNDLFAARERAIKEEEQRKARELEERAAARKKEEEQREADRRKRWDDL